MYGDFSWLFIFVSITAIVFVFVQDHFHRKTTDKMDLVNRNLSDSLMKMRNLKDEYYERVIEIENGVREGVAISLRNDVTQVVCEFNETELSQIHEGLKLMIQCNYNNVSDVEYLVKLIRKAEETIKAYMRSKAEKEEPIA